MPTGRLFQATGPATQNARLPSCSLVLVRPNHHEQRNGGQKDWEQWKLECTSRSDTIVPGRGLPCTPVGRLWKRCGTFLFFVIFSFVCLCTVFAKSTMCQGISFVRPFIRFFYLVQPTIRGMHDISEFEHIYGQMTTTPSCVYDPLFTWTRMTVLVRWSCERSW